jgi:predicted TIM-barrel fold metal-dependent hydrolase
MIGAIDVHSHLYPRRYVAMLRSRDAVPRVVTRGGMDRMLILPGEDADGRPFGGEYWDGARKIAYMDHHGIAASVISPANPWLDFLPIAESVPGVTEMNEDVEALCAESGGRLYGLGALPTRDPQAAARELDRLARLPHLRGAIVNTRGTGQGLDDPALDPMWAAAERTGAMLFVHPHYGLGNEALGGFGHATILAFCFPFETTAAIARLILGGVLDRFPGLKLMVAHAGGVLPTLAGRLDASVASDDRSPVRLREAPSAYLRKLHFDAIGYQLPTLKALIDLVGVDRVMFGTDHPFFPPNVPNASLDTTDWHSPTAHRAMIDTLGAEGAEAILRGNAIATLRL